MIYTHPTCLKGWSLVVSGVRIGVIRTIRYNNIHDMDFGLCYPPFALTVNRRTHSVCLMLHPTRSIKGTRPRLTEEIAVRSCAFPISRVTTPKIYYSYKGTLVSYDLCSGPPNTGCSDVTVHACNVKRKFTKRRVY